MKEIVDRLRVMRNEADPRNGAVLVALVAPSNHVKNLPLHSLSSSGIGFVLGFDVLAVPKVGVEHGGLEAE